MIVVLIAMLFASLRARAQGGGSAPQNLGPQGATTVVLATNYPFASLPASSTNTFPQTYTVTNIYSNVFSIPVTYVTNITTNTVTGYIDLTGQLDLAIQTGFSCTNPTDVSNVVWKLMPSLDGVNADTTNAAWWVTNTSPGSNGLVQTTVFSSAQKSGIAGFFVGEVINLNTNPIFPFLTNATGSNYQFMQVRGTKPVRY